MSETQHPERIEFLEGWSGCETLYTFAAQYEGAARALYEQIITQHREHPHFGISMFPWLHCWRHAFELMLKSIIRKAFSELGKEGEWRPWLGKEGRTHSLEVLRKKAESLCPRLEWDTISVVIEYLDRPDPDGMSFRYPYGKDGSDLLSAIGGDLVGMEGKFRAAAEWLHPFACELPRPGGYRVFERK